MKMYLVVTTIIMLLLTTSACAVSGNTSAPTGPTEILSTKTPEESTATSTSQPELTESPVNILTNSCHLLDSRDLASFFTSHTEIQLPKPQISQVTHPIFSTENAAGKETSCDFYAFHLPGSSAEVMLQVNYWVDVPSPSASSDVWTQAWTQAKSKAAQRDMSGIGDDSFYTDGRLTFKKGNLYVTIEAAETDLDLKTPTGLDRQVAIEKQIALDMLRRF